MKRSEMLTKLQQLLGSRLGHPFYHNLAEDVLSLCEDAGMMPPNVMFHATGDYSTLDELDILHDYDISFAWKPEDES